mgnify:FL=1
MKYCKIGISIISIIVAAICVIMIVRINKAFPNAEEKSYTKDNPANIEGVELTPVSYNVYTIEEYSKISPTNNFSMNQNSDNSRIIVMTVRLKNTTEEVVNYTPSFVCVIEEINGSNGVTTVSPLMRHVTLLPGESKEVMYQAYMGPNQLNPRNFDKIDESTVTLVYSFYPFRNRLIFSKG